MKNLHSKTECKSLWLKGGMILSKLGGCLAAAALLSACAPMEPINGCHLAALNQREVLRAKGYLNPAIPARLVQYRCPNVRMGHIALIYHVDKEWYAYDDSNGTRRLSLPKTMVDYPNALVAARAAFPFDPISSAFWF